MLQFSTGQLLALLEEHEPPCISLYQRTHRHHPDKLQDPIRYRNLLRELESSLRERYGQREIEPLMSKFEPLGRNEAFWNQRTDGLAILAASDLFQMFELQRPVPDLVIVADAFHVKPLLRILQSADRYQILCLARDQAQLYEGNRDALDPVDLIDTPATMVEALGEQVTPAHRDVRSAPGQTIHYGMGERKEELDIDRDRFFRAVDRGITENHSNPSGLPLVLVALTEHHAPFRAVSRNPHLLPEGIEVDPHSLELDELRALAWKHIEPYYLARLEALVDRFRVERSRGMGSDDPREVAQAAVAGRVGSLLVEADRQIAGRIDRTSGRMEPGELSDPDVGDVLNDLAVIVLRMKGEVVVVPKERMPTNTGLAATYRF